jgi:hypothetical protein
MSHAFKSPSWRPTSSRIARSASARRTHGTRPSGFPSRLARRTKTFSSSSRRWSMPVEPIMMRSKSSAIMA